MHRIGFLFSVCIYIGFSLNSWGDGPKAPQRLDRISPQSPTNTPLIAKDSSFNTTGQTPPTPTATHRFRIWSDTHLYGPHAVAVADFNDDSLTVYTGDIYDLTNCARDSVAAVRSKIAQLKREAGNRYVRGNHEAGAFGRGQADDDYLVAIHGVLFTHGHYGIGMDHEGIRQWESHSEGAGKFWRMGRKLGEMLFRHPPLKRQTAARATALLAEYNRRNPSDTCRTIVFGHYHVPALFDETIDGYRVISVLRGLTELEL